MAVPNAPRLKMEKIQIVNTLETIHESALLSAAMFVAFFGFLLIFSEVIQKIDIFRQSTTVSSDRYGSLDGLRGILAFGVVTHHALTAYIYFTTGAWDWSRNPVLNHLGQTTVAIFFMITGFLFTEKCTARSLNWRSLYISRIARLAPLYSIVVVIVFAAVLALSDFTLRVPPAELLKQFVQWLAFVCLGRPDINGMAMSWTLIAGVNWSLKFEWAFYLFGVPLLFAVSRVLSRGSMFVGSLGLLAAAIVLVGIRGELDGAPLYMLHFLCGITSAFIYENKLGRAVISSRMFHLVAASSAILLGFVPNSHNALALVVALLIFLASIGGLSIFGILKRPSAVWLGDISYGVYLIHGLILYATLYALREHGLLPYFGSPLFIGILPTIGAVVTILASLSYVYIEKPMIALGRSLAKRKTVGAQP